MHRSLSARVGAFATRFIIDQQKRYARCVAFMRRHPVLLLPSAVLLIFVYMLVRVFEFFENLVFGRSRRSGKQDVGVKKLDIPMDTYRTWTLKYGMREIDIERTVETARALKYRPLISVVMPVCDPPLEFLSDAIDSVKSQTYDNWELCIADDASANQGVRDRLERYASEDRRIKVAYRGERGNISAATNSALELATGDFVSLLDHDDMLSGNALYEVALLLNNHLDAEIIYSDEDKIDDRNMRGTPHFKPDWCPDSLLSRMYLGHLLTLRRDLIDRLGGLRVGFEGSQDYDLVLRATEISDSVFHIPKVLYHWRIHGSSAASGVYAKPYAYEAALKALSEAFERRGEPLKARHVQLHKGHYSLDPDMKSWPSVRIIIPTRDNAKYLKGCLKSIFSLSTYSDYRVTVVDNGSRSAAVGKLISSYERDEPQRFTCMKMDVPFNFSRINNEAVKAADEECIVFLNDDVEVITPDWLERLCCHAMRRGVGAVGCKLLYPSGRVQHAGIILGVAGLAGHSHKHLPGSDPGYFGHLVSLSNVSAVTAACMACSRKAFEDVGGFDETLSISYNDVDLCLKLIKAGYRNVFVPEVEMVHREGGTRGSDKKGDKRERLEREARIIRERWPQFLRHDPCYSDNLSRNTESYDLRE